MEEARALGRGRKVPHHLTARRNAVLWHESRRPVPVAVIVQDPRLEVLVAAGYAFDPARERATAQRQRELVVEVHTGLYLPNVARRDVHEDRDRVLCGAGGIASARRGQGNDGEHEGTELAGHGRTPSLIRGDAYESRPVRRRVKRAPEATADQGPGFGAFCPSGFACGPSCRRSRRTAAERATEASGGSVFPSESGDTARSETVRPVRLELLSGGQRHDRVSFAGLVIRKGIAHFAVGRSVSRPTHPFCSSETGHLS